jgi:hypothetical protein
LHSYGIVILNYQRVPTNFLFDHTRKHRRICIIVVFLDILHNTFFLFRQPCLVSWLVLFAVGVNYHKVNRWETVHCVARHEGNNTHPITRDGHESILLFLYHF